MNLKVVILAGEYGTRISEESLFKPKPMIEIGDRPVLWHIMKEYSHYGFHEFIICFGYKQLSGLFLRVKTAAVRFWRNKRMLWRMRKLFRSMKQKEVIPGSDMRSFWNGMAGRFSSEA